jgi:DNA helicase-2/ATP-dependent DNA helicase PcrA
VETKSLTDDHKVRWVEKKDASRPGYVMLVPLLEIISEVLGMGVGSKTVLNVYDNLISNLGSEFKVLLNSKPEDIKRLAGEKMAEAIEKVRLGDISISPGFDGVFGKVSIWKEGEKPLDTQSAIDQGSLF